jgi:hypothetical protein
MSLDKTKLSGAIKEALLSMQKVEDANNAADQLAGKLADAIDAYVKEAEVTVVAKPSEIQVQGSATKQTNIGLIRISGNPKTGGGIK